MNIVEPVRVNVLRCTHFTTGHSLNDGQRSRSSCPAHIAPKLTRRNNRLQFHLHRLAVSPAEFCATEFWGRNEELEGFLKQRGEQARGGTPTALVEALQATALTMCQSHPEGEDVQMFGDCILLTTRLAQMRDLLGLASLMDALPLAQREPRVLLLSDAQVLRRTLFLSSLMPTVDVPSMFLLQPKLLLMEFGERASDIVEDLKDFLPECYVALLFLTRPDFMLGPSSMTVEQIRFEWIESPVEFQESMKRKADLRTQKWFSNLDDQD